MNANKPGFDESHDERIARAWVLGVHIARAAAAAMLVGVIVACAPAEATRATESGAEPQTQTNTGVDYFPAQYVNQGREVEEHVPAF